MDTTKVLIVEDEVINRELLEYAIQQIGTDIEIHSTKNGEEALKYIKQNSYDSILLDIFLDGQLDGFDVLQRIRKDKSLENTPVLVITSDVDLKLKALMLQATDFLSKPFNIEALKLRVKNYINHSRNFKKLQARSSSLELEVESVIKELKESLKFSKETEYEISLRLAKASEFRDIETGMHIKRMSIYSKILAKLAGFSSKDQELIFRASPLHDIGKIGIPDSILLKPGKLTVNEFDVMKKHTIIGGEMLEGAEKYPVLKYGKIIAEQHHEKWDGKGYPLGLTDLKIHPFARIVAIADVFDALSSKRVYKPSMPLAKVIEIMKDGKGKHFDPHYFDLFIKNLYMFLDTREEYKDKNEILPKTLDAVRT